MSAETLRRAATLMRRERGAHEFYRAVAEWLDFEAARIEESEWADVEPAVAVATAYLGETA